MTGAEGKASIKEEKDCRGRTKHKSTMLMKVVPAKGAWNNFTSAVSAEGGDNTPEGKATFPLGGLDRRE